MSTRTELESTLEWKNCIHRLASGFLKHSKTLGSARPNLAVWSFLWSWRDMEVFFTTVFLVSLLLGAEGDDLPKTGWPSKSVKCAATAYV